MVVLHTTWGFGKDKSLMLPQNQDYAYPCHTQGLSTKMKYGVWFSILLILYSTKDNQKYKFYPACKEHSFHSQRMFFALKKKKKKKKKTEKGEINPLFPNQSRFPFEAFYFVSRSQKEVPDLLLWRVFKIVGNVLIL